MKKIPPFVWNDQERTFIKYNLISMGFKDLLSYRYSEYWINKYHDYFLIYPKKCTRCGSNKKIQLHHLTYEHLGNEKSKDLIPLCKQCHLWVHKEGWRIRNEFLSLF